MVNPNNTYSRNSRTTQPDAEKIAVSAFTFLAGEPQYLNRFLRLSGVALADLPAISSDPAFLAAVLGFVVNDTSLLETFCQHHAISAQEADLCYHMLNGPDSFS